MLLLSLSCRDRLLQCILEAVRPGEELSVLQDGHVCTSQLVGLSEDGLIFAKGPLDEASLHLSSRFDGVVMRASNVCQPHRFYLVFVVLMESSKRSRRSSIDINRPAVDLGESLDLHIVTPLTGLRLHLRVVLYLVSHIILEKCPLVKNVPHTQQSNRQMMLLSPCINPSLPYNW